MAVAFGLSTLMTPLYLLYQKAFGYSQITLTLIYAAYAIGNVAALLLLGRVSDRAGRRVTALGGIAALIAATFVFLFARGTISLYAGRILSGLGIGVASGTANAWLAELVDNNDRGQAAIIGTSTNFVGLGLAAMLSGLLAQYAPWPLHLSFVVYLVIICVAAAMIWFTRETVQHPDRSQIEINLKLALPQQIRTEFVAPAITGFGLMALVGFYASLMPSILSHDLHIENHAAGGALLFELAMVVALVIIATQKVASRTAMLWSLGLMIPAAAAVVVAQVSASLSVMLVATAIVAVSAGLGYRGSLQVVNQIAPADQRAAVASTYFVCCFIGNAVPVIGVGVLSSLTNTTVADIAFSGMIAAFAVIALVFGTIYRR
ncbi:MFS transporter [Bradyrhizobium tropiciagri]|uniref:MFS transporter n=1 Tax=Bradyrhizobium tropiciagri TaxID=312253 RepID=UPI0020112C37|nr:MFS transporter [Bradyrhizobium tropiciagri]